MIDGITLYFPNEKINVEKCSLSNLHKQDMNSFTGNLGPLRITQNLGGTTINGSLAKFYFNENVSVMDSKSICDSISILEGKTGLNMKHGLICKLETGKNLFTENKPSEYMKLFGESGRYGRVEYSKGGFVETVHYRTPRGDFQFIAYDKGLESAGNIPERYKGLNILRAEYRILHAKGIRRRFGHNLLAVELCKSDILENLENQFYKFYESIPKAGRGFLMTNKKVTPMMFEKILAEQFRQQNPQEYQEILQSLKSAGNIDKTSMKRIRATARNRNKDFKWQSAGPLIKELDGLVESSRNYKANFETPYLKLIRKPA